MLISSTAIKPNNIVARKEGDRHFSGDVKDLVYVYDNRTSYRSVINVPLKRVVFVDGATTWFSTSPQTPADKWFYYIGEFSGHYITWFKDTVNCRRSGSLGPFNKGVCREGMTPGSEGAVDQYRLNYVDATQDGLCNFYVFPRANASISDAFWTYRPGFTKSWEPVFRSHWYRDGLMLKFDRTTVGSIDALSLSKMYVSGNLPKPVKGNTAISWEHDTNYLKYRGEPLIFFNGVLEVPFDGLTRLMFYVSKADNLSIMSVSRGYPGSKGLSLIQISSCFTSLPDNGYDFIICNELPTKPGASVLPSTEYRLTIDCEGLTISSVKEFIRTKLDVKDDVFKDVSFSNFAQESNDINASSNSVSTDTDFMIKVDDLDAISGNNFDPGSSNFSRISYWAIALVGGLIFAIKNS